MEFRNHKVVIIILILLLAFTPIAFIWVWHKHYMIVTLASIAVIWIAEIIYLFYLQGKSIREMKYFLQTFKYKDSAIKFNNSTGDPSLKGLYIEFDKIIEAFQEVKLNNERELLFFKMAAQHAGVGLLAFSRTGEIKLINNAFIELFNLKREKNINHFKCTDQNLLHFIKSVKPGTETIKTLINNQPLQVSAKTVLFLYEKEEYKLIAFHDIKNEIEQSELDAWQKLIRVLRHEIHNSLSPITFLSSGLVQQIDDEIAKSGNIKSDIALSIQEGLRVIRKRSIGLSEFVENYKKLTDLPTPNIQPIPVNAFLRHIESLFKAKAIDRDITIAIRSINNDSIIYIDEKLVEQAIINIINNAIEAIQGIDNGTIWIDFTVSDNTQTISISDNGQGIPPDLLENIFTPFFTTKKSGSGIGLSLSRQIMRLHNGTLTVTTQQGAATTFSLNFLSL